MTQFIFLCITVCLAVAALSLLTCTVLAHLLWSFVRRYSGLRIVRNAWFLFSLRTLPISIPAGLILFAVLPSFLLLEPHQTSERPELWLLGLAFAAALVFVASFVRLTKACFATRRMTQKWLQSAQPLAIHAATPIYALRDPDTLVAVVGIARPRMFIGTKVLERLTPAELRAAIAHEIAHVRSLDNLKQSLLKATRISRSFAQMDRAFCSAAEISADSSALQTRVSPLDLGSAIVKVARLKTAPPMPAITASHLVPDFEKSELCCRVEHLQAAFGDQHGKGDRSKYAWVMALGLLFLYFFKLPALLITIHRFTELLVR